jgi:hypothetical protein
MAIYLNQTLKNIAVRLSGGPDSSIIYYAVCDFYKDDPLAQIFPYTISTPLRPHSGPRARRVVDMVARATGVNPTKHYISWYEDHNEHNTREKNSLEYTRSQDMLCDEIIRSHSINIHYSGLSINCPIEDLGETIDLHGLDEKECRYSLTTRDESRDVPTEQVISNRGNTIMCLPFARDHKLAVRAEFDRYGVIDDLFPITWSCEHNSQKDQQDPLHCGKCYFCIERIYAFGRLE